MTQEKRILLIIGGGIAAFKALELIRLLQKREFKVRVILTQAAKHFVTPLSLATLTQDKVYDDLFELTDNQSIGHIELSRDADLIVVAPATADLLAKAAQGFANDLASTVLLATDKKVLVAPAMNVRMWHHPATQRNIQTLTKDGYIFIGPDKGEMACGEFGLGRMSEPSIIADAILSHFHSTTSSALSGVRVVVTSGPTREAIDPVRYISNSSSGKQGHALAQAFAHQGADVTLITGPVELPDPAYVRTLHVTTAQNMYDAVCQSLPCDIFIGAAAVADWRVVNQAPHKIKKSDMATPPTLTFEENVDILSYVGHLKTRPTFVVGFAAETNDLISHAEKKLHTKNCDFILANDVSEGNVFGDDMNHIHIVSRNGVENLNRQSKSDLAKIIVDRLAKDYLKAKS